MPKKVDMCEEYKGHLVYDNKKFCYQCIRRMAEIYKSFPNDGTLAGAALAHAISTGEFKCEHYSCE